MRAGLWDNQTIDRLATEADSPVAAARPPGDTQGRLKSLLKRGEFLLPQDRLLLEMSVRGHFTRREMGDLLHLEPGTVSRRLARLGARLHNPLSTALVDPNCPLPPEYRQLGIEHFLQGQSARELAELHAMTPREVKRILIFIRGWHRGLTHRPEG